MNFKQSAQLNEKKAIILLVVGIVVIIGGVAVAVFWLKPDKSQQPTGQPAQRQDQATAYKPTVINKESEAVTAGDKDSLVAVKSVRKKIDEDGDGVDDAIEKQIGTDPNNIDSDYDDLPDGEEIYAWKTNPLTKDTDKDKLFDYWEVKRYFTDPLNPDTDGDGYLDGEEVLNGYNPKGPGKM